MEKKTTCIRINGGKELVGSILIEPNKNAVLPAICASVLTKEDCIMHHVPKSPDVLKLVQAITELGGTHEWNNSTLILNCKNVENIPISDCVADIQSAILFAGPMLARFGTVNIPVAIGCKLGYRGPEDHIEYLSKFGASCKVENNNRVVFNINRSVLVDNDEGYKISLETIIKQFIFSESSVTPTENLLMLLSVVTKFDAKLEGIASEPHIKFLIKILKQMGMGISGEGSILTTTGYVGELRGFEIDFENEPDYVDFYGTAISVALTQGTVKLICKPTLTIQYMVSELEKTGIDCSVVSDGVIIRGSCSTFSPNEGFPKARNNEQGIIWKLNPKPWSGFPVDCLPSFIVWASVNQHQNTKVTVDNWMYEDGLAYVHQLNELGAHIKTIPTEIGEQKIFISDIGSEEYFSKDTDKEIVIDGVPVIEGARCLFSASLARNGTTIIKDIGPLLRRSPDFIKKFQELGADIEIVDQEN